MGLNWGMQVMTIGLNSNYCTCVSGRMWFRITLILIYRSSNILFGLVAFVACVACVAYDYVDRQP
jgi:hypothetical protein